MTQDLTKITTPFGLLDAETQEALRAHGGPYERWDGFDWAPSEFNGDEWRATAWRVKPQLPKPREWWIREGDESVIPYVDDPSFKSAWYIHVREVLK